MTPDFVKALLAEEARLESELRRLSQYRQLEAVRDAIQRLTPVYEADTRSGVAVDPKVSGDASARGNSGRERAGSVTSIISQTALELLQRTGRRATSSEIVSLMKSKGHDLRGKKPTSQVAGALSQNPLFDNANDERGTGYGLASWRGETSLDSRGESEIKTQTQTPASTGEAGV